MITTLLYLLSCPPLVVGLFGGVTLTVISLGIAAKVKTDYETPFLSLGDLRAPSSKPKDIDKQKSVTDQDPLFNIKLAEVEREWAQFAPHQKKLVERIYGIGRVTWSQIGEEYKSKAALIVYVDSSIRDYLLERTTLLKRTDPASSFLTHTRDLLKVSFPPETAWEIKPELRVAVGEILARVHDGTFGEGVKRGYTKKRDFLVERLTDFTKEAGQPNKWRGFNLGRDFLEVGLWDKIEKFLEIHLPNEVERFKKKGIDGVEEIIAELLDVQPKPQNYLESFEAKEQRRISLEELEEEYEPLKKLEPNFVDFGNEYVEAYNDEKGVIVRGSLPDRESFNVLARSFGNEHPRKKVRSLQKVSFRLIFICFDKATRNRAGGPKIHRGAWLTEAETEVDFPAHCPPRRAIIVTAEGSENRVYGVRRDSDSSYKGILPLREELTGSIYTVLLSLLVESRNSASFQYILEIIREPSFELRLTDAVTWKSGHLHKFVSEGFAFSDRLHEIWKDASDQVPIKLLNTSVPNMLLLSSFNTTEKTDYPDSLARMRAIEREQEGNLLDEIKGWEARAADWVDQFIGAEQCDKLLKSAPSFEDGLNRAQKSAYMRIRPQLVPREGEPPPSPQLGYWTLSDAVSSRRDKLMEIIKHLS